MRLHKRLFADFCVFAKAQVVTWDLDPMYVLLKRVYETAGLQRETALWRTLLYLAWYHVGSAEKVWKKYPTPRPFTKDDVMGLPTGSERRGFRGNAHAAAFINSALKKASSLERWVDSYGAGTEGWDTARLELQSLPWCGPWSSYKWADLMKNVHGLPLVASDLGVGGGSITAGPIPGMARLIDESWVRCAQDKTLQMDLYKASLGAGVPFSGLDQLETALCDFNSLCKGRYYVGHDIDDQMDKLKHSSAALWEARDVFSPGRRGELNGWTGVRKELKNVYIRTGKVLT